MRLAVAANPSTRPEPSLFHSCNLRGLLDFSLTPCPRQTRLSSRTARCVVPSSSRMSSSRVWALSSAHRRRHSLTWSDFIRHLPGHERRLSEIGLRRSSWTEQGRQPLSPPPYP